MERRRFHRSMQIGTYVGMIPSVQSSLHAQLAMNTDGPMSTAALVGRLNRQLYENTPADKYATFYCGIYDEQTSRLSYTNAGHLPPILLRGGNAMRLETSNTVVGMFPTVLTKKVWSSFYLATFSLPSLMVSRNRRTPMENN